MVSIVIEKEETDEPPPILIPEEESRVQSKYLDDYLLERPRSEINSKVPSPLEKSPTYELPNFPFWEEENQDFPTYSSTISALLSVYSASTSLEELSEDSKLEGSISTMELTADHSEQLIKYLLDNTTDAERDVLDPNGKDYDDFDEREKVVYTLLRDLDAKARRAEVTTYTQRFLSFVPD